MSADETLGLVYAPTGNSVPDYYGAQRRQFDEMLTAAVVALDAETGALRWVYQTTHHDLWDYDVASQPTLVDLPAPDGSVTKALLQPTKRGEIFMLDRVTGRPLARVEERAVPQSGKAPGERPSPTQPFNAELPSFGGQKLRETDMWGITPLDQLWCRIRFRQARYDGAATLPGLTPSINFPGYMGGMNWGSVAVDPARGIMFVNTNLMANYNVLLPRNEADRLGIRPIRAGAPGDVGGTVAQAKTRFAAKIAPFLSPLGVPCTRPPFGLVAAVDLHSRKLLWAKPFGTARDSGPMGLASGLPIVMGVPNTGGALLTRSGLAFIGATQERNFRAFDTRTGEELWNVRLPAGGQATPMTYRSPSGRQMVVISAGGSAVIASRTGQKLVAFALPRSPSR